MTITLLRDYDFEAAHFLPHVPDGHKCRRMHGHSYKVRVTLRGPIDPKLGWLMDFSEVDAVVDSVLAELDHRVLNEVGGLENPTSELLAVWLWRRLVGKLPVLEVNVSETESSSCAYRGEA